MEISRTSSLIRLSGRSSSAPTSQLPRSSATFSFKDIKSKLRSVIEAKLSIKITKIEELSLFYIRGVSEVRIDGEEIEVVIFEPEFLYVAQVGTSRLAGVSLRYRMPNSSIGPIGLGDPHFPDFDKAEFFSVAGLDSHELIFPAIAGTVMVGMQKDIPEQEAIRRLSTILNEPKVLIAESGLYSGQTHPFDEDATIKRLEAEIEGIRFAELNRVVRLIDFAPGWMVDQVA